MSKNTLFDNIWEQHEIKKISSSSSLLAVDRVLIHDLSGTYVFQIFDSKPRALFRPETVFAIPDHTLVTKKGRTATDSESGKIFMTKLMSDCEKHGIEVFGLESEHQGVIHVVAPEVGLCLPGCLIVCGDSHTCTNGAMGCGAIGIGISEVYHAMTTSTIILNRPKNMNIHISGTLAATVSAMDVALYILSVYGNTFASGYAVEYTGDTVRNMSMEDRLTLCNLTSEMGALTAIVAPDKKTYDFLQHADYAPKGTALQQMAEYCNTLLSTEESLFDRTIHICAEDISRQVSWGINPSQTVSICGTVPEITPEMDSKTRESTEKAYAYMGLTGNQEIKGLPIDYVFIGSCSNGRLSNIAAAAEIVKGTHVADNVKAYMIPGSRKIKEEAEKLGLDKIYLDAGWIWGEPCCGLCAGANGEYVPPQKRCVSTSNRNFIGRQGVGARTHLASPYTAAMAAIHGRII